MWAFFGIINLIILSYQDLFKNNNIDDRKNYFMRGMTFSLLGIIPISFWYIFVLIIGLIIFILILNKYKTLAEGDTSTLGWIFLGFGILGVNALLLFSTILIINTGVWTAIRYFIIRKKTDKAVAFIPIIAISFLISCLGYWVFFY